MNRHFSRALLTVTDFGERILPTLQNKAFRFHSGARHLSVLVQDVATGEPVPSARVTVTMAPRGRPGEAVRHPATTEAETNKLFHAALFELPESGWWEVVVVVEGSMGNAQVRFALEAAEPSPQWPALWPWFGWPALAIALFGIHPVLVRRRSPRSSPNP